MEKQKVCIIGGGLTGLVTALTFGKLNLSVDLITEDYFKNYINLRTTALSESNCIFLKKINVLDNPKKNLWPCSQIKLYDSKINTINEKIFDFENFLEKKNILYMIKNHKVVKIFKNKIKKNKNITIIPGLKVSKLYSDNGLKFIETYDKKIYKYNLVIICAGKNSSLTKKFLNDRYFNYSYEEVSLETIIRHNSTKNIIARQFFLKDGPLAFLPISNTETSIVWSIKNSVFKNIENKKYFFEKKFTKYNKEYIQKCKIFAKS